MKQVWPATIGALTAMAAVGWNTPSLKTEVSPRTKVAGLEAHETHAAVSLLGQFRTTISGWLWVRADLYLHNGTELRPITDQERATGRSVATEAKGENLDHGTEVTVVPPSDRDFRGVFGNVEREISAYKDMHGHAHNDPVAVLPLFRLMTWLDPQFVPGWTQAAQILGRDRSKAGALKAIDYLKQGLEQNPESIEILQQIGYTYAVPHPYSDVEHAISPLARAVDIGFRHFKELDEDEHDALLASTRWLALCYRERGNRAAMQDVAREGLSRFEGDPILTELSEPTILTAKGKAAMTATHPAPKPTPSED